MGSRWDSMRSRQSPGDVAAHFITAAPSLFASVPLNGSTQYNLHMIKRITLVESENKGRDHFHHSQVGTHWSPFALCAGQYVTMTEASESA